MAKTPLRYTVTAECVNKKTGERLLPGVEFLPAPDPKRAQALIDAGCIEEVFTDPEPETEPTDAEALAATTDAGLAQIASDEKIDVSAATDRDGIIAAILVAREAAAKA